MMARPTRRDLLGVALFTALAGVAAVAVANPETRHADAEPTDTDERRCRNAMEVEMLRIYRAGSPSEKAAMHRLIERMLAGQDAHAAGIEYMLALGMSEAEARERTANALAPKARERGGWLSAGGAA